MRPLSVLRSSGTRRGGGSPVHPSNGGGLGGSPNNGGGSANSPTLSGGASNSANASNAPNASPSGPGAGQRPLDFIPNALNGFVNQFQDGGQNLQKVSNAMREVAQTFEDQWTKKDGGTNQLIAMAAFHGIGGVLKYLAPAIKGAAGEAAAAAPAVGAKAAAAATGFVARAKNALAGLAAKFRPASKAVTQGTLKGTADAAGETGGAGAVNAVENTAPQTLNGSANAAGENAVNAAKTGGVPADAGEPGASNPGTSESPLAAEEASNGLPNLTDQVVKIGGKTFELGAMRGDPGTYGTVYEIKNMPGSLLKLVRFDEAGADSITSQLAGKQLLATAETNIATPAMEDASAQGVNALIVQDVTKAFPGGKAFNSTDVATAAEKAAIKTMLNEMAKKGLVWEDAALRNTFVYDTPNGLRAGILDTDRIFPFSEIGNQPEGVQMWMALKMHPFLRAAGVHPNRATAEDYMDALYRLYYGG